jgi:hypothetical protein
MGSACRRGVGEGVAAGEAKAVATGVPADVDLDGDQVTADRADGDAGHATAAYISHGFDIRRGRRHHQVMAHETGQSRARRSSLGYSVVLFGATLFVASCFVPYYGYELSKSGTVSLYNQRIVVFGGGLQVGANLVLFGGIATVVVVALVGLTRRQRPVGRGFLAGAVTVWSLTLIGSLLQIASLRGGKTVTGYSLEIGFWLQAVSIGVVVIGTIFVGFGKRGSIKNDHDRYTTAKGIDAGA